MTEPPSFNGCIYWYVVILCTCQVAVIAVSHINLLFVQSNFSEEGVALWEGLSTFGSMVFAATTAKLHQLGTWRAVSGYVIGTFIVITMLIPLTLGAHAIAFRLEYPIGRILALAVFITYAIGCATAIGIGRGHSLRRRQQQHALVDVF
jgi:hypothetical protein